MGKLRLGGKGLSRDLLIEWEMEGHTCRQMDVPD